MVSVPGRVSSPTQAGVYTCAIILIVASIVAVGLRFASRRITSQAWRSDDWLVCLAMLLLWAVNSLLIWGASQGTVGTHTEINPQTHQVVVTKHNNQISVIANVSQLLVIVALGALKSSVVLFYRRIFIGNVFRRVSLAVLILIAAWTIAFFFATLFECDGHAFDYLWKSLYTYKTYCQKYKDIWLGHCVSDVATDLIVLSMPLPPIWNLHMKLKWKITVSVIFLLGLLSTAAGVARLYIVAVDQYETTAGSRDVQGTTTNALIWTVVEIGVGIVAACLPLLRPVLDSRTLESIVASVRSRVSITSSNNSRNNSRPGPSSRTAASEYYDLPDYPDKSRRTDSDVSSPV